MVKNQQLRFNARVPFANITLHHYEYGVFELPISLTFSQTGCILRGGSDLTQT